MSHHWICDSCGQPILKPEDGWVEWTKARVGENLWVVTQMRLVHHCTASPKAPDGTCQFDEADEFQNDKATVSDRPLKDYLGSDGLMRLLEHAADPAFKIIDVIGMLKRIQVPGYDQAKGFFDRAIQEGVIELNQPKGFYTLYEIEAVIEHYDSGAIESYGE